MNEDGTFANDLESVTSNAIKYNFYIEENNKIIFMTYVYTNGQENYVCLIQENSYFIFKNIVYNKVKNFNINSNPIYNDNFLSLAPFFNIYGDKNQEQGKLFITYIAPASNYDVSIESKVYSLNGKKYKLVNPNLVVLWEEK